MKNARQGRIHTGRLTALIAALTAAFILAMPAAAATCTASDVMIRNSGEEKDGNIIGSLNKGDQVTVISRSVDSTGTEWYYIELPNGNTGYVKAQWIDNGGEDVVTIQPAETSSDTEEEKQEEAQEETEPAADEADAADDAAEEDDAGEDGEGLDDWLPEDEDAIADLPAGDVDTVVTSEDGAEGEGGESIANEQTAPSVEETGAYDPYTDPAAQYSINFITEDDGTGSWYVYNYDTDRRIRLGDLDKMNDAQEAARKSAASAGRWRVFAIILLIALLAVLAFLYMVMRRNTPSTPSVRSRRRRPEPRYDEEEEEEEDEDDDTPFSLDELDDMEKAEPVSLRPASKKGRASTAEQTSAAAGRTEEDAEESDVDPEGPEGDKDMNPVGRAAAFAAEEYEDEDEEESGEDESAGSRAQGSLFPFRKKKPSAAVYDDEDADEDPEEDIDENDDDYYDDEDEEDAPAGRGVIGFLKNIFSSDGLGDDDYDDEYDDEDDDDDEYDDEDDEEDYEPAPAPRSRIRSGRSASGKRAGQTARPRREPVRRSYDDAADYPEDAELLTAVGRRASRDAAAEKASRLDEGRTAAPQTSAPAQTAPAQTAQAQNASAGTRGYEDFYADEDDDMEYSFLSSSSSRKNRRS